MVMRLPPLVVSVLPPVSLLATPGDAGIKGELGVLLGTWGVEGDLATAGAGVEAAGATLMLMPYACVLSFCLMTTF